MRLPFIKKATKSDKLSGYSAFDISLRTPTYEFTPSDTLQLVIHLPANGFIHLRPPLDAVFNPDTPGQYDHILNGVLEVIAPMGWRDSVDSITVGYRVSCKLSPVKGREDEVDTLFERRVSLADDITIAPGSQR